VRILITGSSGFLGLTFGRISVQAGHEVMGLGRAPQASAEWLGDYRSSAVSTENLCTHVHEFQPEVIFHGAGTASVALSFTDPSADYDGSVQLFRQVLEAMRLAGSRALLFFPSSAAVYGNPESLPVAEDAPVRPISPYGFHKAICETIAREYAECFDLNVVSCRLFSVFGQLQQRLLVWELFRQLNGPEDSVTLEGTGTESRDFLEGKDAVKAMLALTAGLQDAARGFRAVNLAAGIETKISDLAFRMRDLVAPRKEIRFRGTVRKGDPLNWCADISLLKTLAPGWAATSLNEALSNCIADWQQRSPLGHHGS